MSSYADEDMSQPTAGATPYKVGDKHPPLHSRFKPGQSGNKKGRPKGSCNLVTIVDEGLHKVVTGKKGGKIFKMPGGDVVADSLIELALNKNLKAIELLMKIQRDAASAKRANEGMPGPMVEEEEFSWEKELKRLSKELKDLGGLSKDDEGD